jgi:hypothetical protein
MLDSDAAVRRLVPDGGDDAHLRIGPLDGADARGFAERRGFSVGRRHQPGPDRAVIG